MDEVRIPSAGDPFIPAPTRRSSRHHRVDEDFLALLREDFGVDRYSLTRAFLGVPPASKNQAVKVCEWAASRTEDPVERGTMIRRWARKHGVGLYHPEIQGAPPLTFDGSTGFGLEGV